MNTNNEHINQFNDDDDGLCTIERATDNAINDNLNKDELVSNTKLDQDNESSIDQQLDKADCDKKLDKLSTDQQISQEQQQPILDQQQQLNIQFNKQQIEDDDNSSTSSSHPPVDVPFRPNYSVQILPNELEVNEYTINYVIKAVSLCKIDEKDKLSRDKPREMVVKRDHDDFLYLNHVLINSAYPGYGLICAPISNKPNLDDVYLLKQEALFKRNSLLNNLLFDDQWQKECWFLEHYLHSMLNHPTFGKDPFWQRFLMINEAPPKIKLKKNGNLFTSLFTSGDQDLFGISSSKHPPTKMLHPDCDDYFQRERNWLHYYQLILKESLDYFNSRMHARTRLCNSLEHLSTILTLNFSTDDGLLSRILSKLNNTFSNTLIEQSNAMSTISLNDETTISCNFEFFERYLRNAMYMMNNRVCLLIDYENANRNLEKAKTGSKRQAVSYLF